MSAHRRRRLAQHRKRLGLSQEGLANALQIERSTVGRWESGESTPQPWIRPKIAQALQLSLEQVDELLAESDDGAATALFALPKQASVAEIDDMKRRELLRVISMTGALLALPPPETDAATTAGTDLRRQIELATLAEHAQLNDHLWQVFSLASPKSQVLPLVLHQLDVLCERLRESHGRSAHQRLCILAGDLFQIAGEIFFDSNRYTDAAHCYTLAANASREADAYDLWACALTRHAFIGMYERNFTQAASLLSAASRVAQRGDSQLSTRHWVAAVQAEAFAGLGDLDACDRALGNAEKVLALSGPVKNGGWLRFDGSRLAEERGTCYLELGKTRLAEAALSDALSRTISLRRRGSVLADLAMAGFQSRDIDQVLEYGVAAVELAEQTQSAGYVGRKLQSLQSQLSPLKADGRVSVLSLRISQLSVVAR